MTLFRKPSYTDSLFCSYFVLNRKSDKIIVVLIGTTEKTENIFNSIRVLTIWKHLIHIIMLIPFEMCIHVNLFSMDFSILSGFSIHLVKNKPDKSQYINYGIFVLDLVFSHIKTNNEQNNVLYVAVTTTVSLTKSKFTFNRSTN